MPPSAVICDDSSVMLEVARRATQKCGFEVVGSFLDGFKAWMFIREHAPDLAFLDYTIPQMTGIEIARAIKCDNLPTKVVLATAAGQKGALEMDVLDGYVIKPYTVPVLQIELYKAGFRFENGLVV